MAETKFMYDNASVSGGRYLILNDTKQEMPAERLKVLGAELRTTKDGREYPVLQLEGEDGNLYDCSAWPRDVAACIKQWNGDPTLWGYVQIKLDGRRYAVVPADNQNPREEPIGSA
jgi:hypothetical protein